MIVTNVATIMIEAKFSGFMVCSLSSEDNVFEVGIVEEDFARFG
jgi:hypothetical protein